MQEKVKMNQNKEFPKKSTQHSKIHFITVVKNWWQFLNTDFSIKLRFWNPTRAEYLTDKILTAVKKKHVHSNKEVIFETVTTLQNRDFAIFSLRGSNELFIQCTKQNGRFEVDYPFSVIDVRSKLLHRLEYVLGKLGYSRKRPFLAGVFSSSIEKYYQLVRINYGNSYVVYCGSSAKETTHLMHAILTQVYGLPANFPMEIKVESWKKIWF